MEDNIRFALEIFMAVVITGLGGKEVLGKWHEHRLKSQEKLLDHDLHQDDKNSQWLRSQLEMWQNRYREVEEVKFRQIGENIAQLMETMSPCHELLSELLNNRTASAERDAKIMVIQQQQNDEIAQMKATLTAMQTTVTGISTTIGVGSNRPNKYGRTSSQLNYDPES